MDTAEVTEMFRARCGGMTLDAALDPRKSDAWREGFYR